MSKKRSSLPWLAAAAILVMACVVYAEIRARPIVHDAPLPQATAADIHSALSAPSRQAMPEKNRFAAIVERPLFSPSRQPRSMQTSAAPAVSAPSVDFSLFGVVIGTDEAVAVVKPDAGGNPMRVKQGEQISGWTVARIEPDRVLVRRDVLERELLLDFATPAPPPKPAARQTDVAAAWQLNEEEERVQPSETDPAIDQPSAD